MLSDIHGNMIIKNTRHSVLLLCLTPYSAESAAIKHHTSRGPWQHPPLASASLIICSNQEPPSFHGSQGKMNGKKAPKDDVSKHHWPPKAPQWPEMASGSRLCRYLKKHCYEELVFWMMPVNRGCNQAGPLG